MKKTELIKSLGKAILEYRKLILELLEYEDKRDIKEALESIKKEIEHLKRLKEFEKLLRRFESGKITEKERKTISRLAEMLVKS